MTISSDDRRTGPMSGDGSTTDFVVDFPFDLETDFHVYVEDGDGNQTLQALNVQYTVSENNLGGGKISFTTAPASTESVLVIANDPTGSTYTLPGETIDRTALEAAFDKLAKQIQNLNERIDRAVLIDKFASQGPAELSEPAAAGSYLYAQSVGPVQLAWGTPSTFDVTLTPLGQTLVSTVTTVAQAQAALNLTPDTDIPAKTTYDAHVADTTLHQTYHLLTDTVQLAFDDGTPAVTWTAVDITANKLNANHVATHAILRLRLEATELAGGASNKVLTLKVRKTGTTPTTPAELKCTWPGATAGAIGSNSNDRLVIVELDSNEQFDYDFSMTNGDSSDLYEIRLEGYIA